MIEFDNLQSGLYYYTSCPLCNNHMRIECLSANNSFNGRGYTITFGLDGDDKLVINPVTEEVVIYYHKKISYKDFSYKNDNDLYVYQPIESYTNTYNGAIHYGLTVSCPKEGCGNFSYALKLLIDLNKPLLKNVVLSNIRIYVKDGSETCEISNYYNLNKTTFGFDGTNGGQFVNLPLIDINLENPQETLLRIKKLIIFT